MIAPIVEQIHGELGDKIKVVKMDIDENPSVPMQLGIMSIPTVIIFKDGKPAERTVGYRPNMKGDLKAKLEALISYAVFCLKKKIAPLDEEYVLDKNKLIDAEKRHFQKNGH